METSAQARPWIAVFAAVVGIAVLTAFAGVAPLAMRKIVLFSIAFGAASGGIIVWTAREWGLPRRWAMLLAAPLVIAGLLGISLQGHRQLLAERERQAANDPQQAFALKLMEAAAQQDPKIAEEREAAARAQHPTFTDYLALRVQPLGEWPQPWPILFWGAEMLLAVAAGEFIIVRQHCRPPEPAEELP